MTLPELIEVLQRMARAAPLEASDRVEGPIQPWMERNWAAAVLVEMDRLQVEQGLHPVPALGCALAVQRGDEMWSICHSCGGHGQEGTGWADHYGEEITRECASCGGSGVQFNSHITNGAFLRPAWSYQGLEHPAIVHLIGSIEMRKKQGIRTEEEHVWVTSKCNTAKTDKFVAVFDPSLPPPDADGEKRCRKCFPPEDEHELRSAAAKKAAVSRRERAAAREEQRRQAMQMLAAMGLANVDPDDVPF